MHVYLFTLNWQVSELSMKRKRDDDNAENGAEYCKKIKMENRVLYIPDDNDVDIDIKPNLDDLTYPRFEMEDDAEMPMITVKLEKMHDIKPNLNNDTLLELSSEQCDVSDAEGPMTTINMEQMHNDDNNSRCSELFNEDVEIKRILKRGTVDGKKVFLFERLDGNGLAFMPNDVVKQKYPQAVLDFYESHIVRVPKQLN